MADCWYVEEAGRESGPVSFAQLQLLAVERKISPATLVRPTHGPSLPAGEVPGLFAAPESPTPANEEPGSSVPRWVVPTVVGLLLSIGGALLKPSSSPPPFSAPPPRPPQLTPVDEVILKSLKSQRTMHSPLLQELGRKLQQRGAERLPDPLIEPDRPEAGVAPERQPVDREAARDRSGEQPPPR
jgi:hypothetical protein